MLHLKTHVSGIDVEIQDMQKDIYSSLTETYGFENVEGYGRLQRKEEIAGTFPQWFNSVTGQHEIVYFNTTKDIVFSFIEGEDHRTEDGVMFVAPVKIVFWFNLDKISANEYRDSEAQRIASTIVKKDTYTTFTYDRLQKTIKKVYAGFQTGDIKLSDKQPYTVFSININLTYRLTKKC